MQTKRNEKYYLEFNVNKIMIIINHVIIICYVFISIYLHKSI